MQGPTGSSGVQSFPNSGQPFGRSFPQITSPQRQPLCSFAATTFAWKIPWAEEPGGLQSMGSLRVGHD